MKLYFKPMILKKLISQNKKRGDIFKLKEDTIFINFGNL
jgi:hypothetical protein